MKTEQSVLLSVVVPVYRSEATLPALYSELVSVLETAEPSFEI
ncbi:MAG: glycosyltransferase, partial [Betaproteobacteria bacterium]